MYLLDVNYIRFCMVSHLCTFFSYEEHIFGHSRSTFIHITMLVLIYLSFLIIIIIIISCVKSNNTLFRFTLSSLHKETLDKSNYLLILLNRENEDYPLQSLLQNHRNYKDIFEWIPMIHNSICGMISMSHFHNYSFSE